MVVSVQTYIYIMYIRCHVRVVPYLKQCMPSVIINQTSGASNAAKVSPLAASAEGPAHSDPTDLLQLFLCVAIVSSHVCLAEPPC